MQYFHIYLFFSFFVCNVKCTAHIGSARAPFIYIYCTVYLQMYQKQHQQIAPKYAIKSKYIYNTEREMHAMGAVWKMPYKEYTMHATILHVHLWIYMYIVVNEKCV